MKLIYESKRPIFYILTDEMQWILSFNQLQGKDGRDRYKRMTYHSGLGDLLSYLAETLFRKEAKKVKQLTDLSEVVYKVHKQIEKVIGEKLGDLG
jgi:hypothetical protein